MWSDTAVCMGVLTGNSGQIQLCVYVCVLTGNNGQIHLCVYGCVYR